MSSQDAERAPQGFSIGTVAGLTGLDPHTIRAWERRHAAVVPGRSPGGTRRYDDSHVLRLQLLKGLVDQGEAIGRVAHLDEPALRERLGRIAGMAGGEARQAVRGRPAVAWLAPNVEAQLDADPAADADLDRVLSADDLDTLLAGLPGIEVDSVVVELERLGPDPEQALAALRVAADGAEVLVVYNFAAAAALARLVRVGARLLRAPLRGAEIRQAVVATHPREPRAKAVPAALGSSPAGEAHEPRFDDTQLARLMEMQTAIACECPSHLAALVSSVGAFERYSRTCESRGDEDALLHRRLALESGRIRSQLETLLEQVCRHDGLAI